MVSERTPGSRVTRATLCAARAVGVAELPVRSDAVAHQALELRQVREAALLRARPHDLAVDADVEDAAVTGDERDLAELRGERGEQLLRRPAGAHQPAALGAVLDLDARGAMGGGRHGSWTIRCVARNCAG